MDTKRLASDALFASVAFHNYLTPLRLGWFVEVSHAGNTGSSPVGITIPSLKQKIVWNRTSQNDLICFFHL